MTAEKLMESVLHSRAALELLHFTYPVNEYYRAVMEEENPAAPERKASYIAAFRHEDRVWRMDMEETEYLLLKKLFSGVKVAEALESMSEVDVVKISEYFSRWMRNGLLAAHEYKGELHERITHEAA
jgi:hypothetical protein